MEVSGTTRAPCIILELLAIVCSSRFTRLTFHGQQMGTVTARTSKVSLRPAGVFILVKQWLPTRRDFATLGTSDDTRGRRPVVGTGVRERATGVWGETPQMPRNTLNARDSFPQRTACPATPATPSPPRPCLLLLAMESCRLLHL